MLGADQVAELAAHQRTRALWVFPRHHFIPDADLGLGFHHDQFQALHLASR